MSKISVSASPQIADLVGDAGGNETAGSEAAAATAGPSLHQSYFTSYSANFEDVILNRLFARKPNGFYVDIGAAHPRFENDTKLFYDRGWTGINVEPNPAFFELFAGERPRDRNFCLAVSETAGDIDFYEVVDTGLSTCDERQAEIARQKGHAIVKRSVSSTTLASILQQVDPPAIDFLKIDVEGFEQQVLSGNDWTRFRPSVVIVEVTYPESPIRRVTAIRDYLEKLGYQWRYFDGLNDFYVADDFEIADDVFDRPPNVFDGFKLRATVDLEQQLAHLSDSRQQSEEYAQALAAALETAREYGAELQRALADIDRKHSDQTSSLTVELEASRNYTAELEVTLAEFKRKDAEQVGSLRDTSSLLQMTENRVRIELANEKFERHNLSVAAEAMRKELVALHSELERWTSDRAELLHLRALRASEIARHSGGIFSWASRSGALAPLPALPTFEFDSTGAPRDELQRVRAELEDMRARLFDAEASRQALLTSSSWRFMRPYRVAGRTLKALAQRFLR